MKWLLLRGAAGIGLLMLAGSCAHSFQQQQQQVQVAQQQSSVVTDHGLTIIGFRVLNEGRAWGIAAKGKAESLRLEFALRNVGTEPLPVWDPRNSEGSASPRVVLTAADGRQAVLVPVPVERSGIPSAVTLSAAGGELPVVLDLAQMTGTEDLTPGIWRGRLIYANRQPASGPVKRVWMGEVSSVEFELQVVRR